MLDKKTGKSIQKKVIDKLIQIEKSDVKEVCEISIVNFETWEWPQGVGLYGLLRQYEADQNEEGIQWIKEWFSRRRQEGLPEKNVNTMAPMLTMAYLYERTKKKEYYELCQEWANWVLEEMPRTKDNGLQHIVTGHKNKGQIWDDTLYMTVLFIGKWGMVTGEQKFIEEAVRQFLVHIKYLYDKNTGLWFHGFQFGEQNHNFANALWARGNCWITAAIPDFIEMVKLDVGVKLYLVDTLKAQVDALKKYQDSSGLWHTLIDCEDSYLETSATAGFGYGILKAVRMGLLSSEYREIGEKALLGVLSQIDEDGIVLNVSYGTGMGETLDDYRVIPICPMAYGQSLTFMLLEEAMKL